MTTQPRPLARRLLQIAVAGVLVVGCLAAALWTNPFVRAVATCVTFTPKPDRTVGPAIPPVPGADPTRAVRESIPDRMIVADTQLRFVTTLPPAQVFAFYERELADEGWTDSYRNTETNQLFLFNAQGCPFYGLDILVQPARTGSQVTIDPYTHDFTCTCEV